MQRLLMVLFVFSLALPLVSAEKIGDKGSNELQSFHSLFRKLVSKSFTVREESQQALETLVEEKFKMPWEKSSLKTLTLRMTLLRAYARAMRNDGEEVIQRCKGVTPTFRNYALYIYFTRPTLYKKYGIKEDDLAAILPFYRRMKMMHENPPKANTSWYPQLFQKLMKEGKYFYEGKIVKTVPRQRVAIALELYFRYAEVVGFQEAFALKDFLIAYRRSRAERNLHFLLHFVGSYFSSDRSTEKGAPRALELDYDSWSYFSFATAAYFLNDPILIGKFITKLERQLLVDRDELRGFYLGFCDVLAKRKRSLLERQKERCHY